MIEDVWFQSYRELSQNACWLYVYGNHIGTIPPSAQHCQTIVLEAVQSLDALKIGQTGSANGKR